MTAHKFNMAVNAPVAAALDSGQPVVALESTIITHGMPYPENIETAHAVEEIIRKQGAVPATTAVLDGTLHIGLTDNQTEKLAKAKNVMKLSRADFAFALAQGRTGSTTVAATMIAAQLAGISVFATGGIGGVHRGAEETFDISADLTELGKTNVVVVCAGAKAILDLPKTLEVLESQGVPVIAYGVDTLPAFWSRDSGLPAPMRMDTANDIASHAYMRSEMGLSGGTLIANPVPKEHEIPRTEMNKYIEQALINAAQEGISGKAVTPYLLSNIVAQTDGKSLKTNIELIKNNAELAADIAVCMCR